jgi:hypothetical protein
MQIAAATVAPAALGGMPSLATPRRSHHLVLFEASLAPAVAFARSARAHGVPTRALRDGDITDAWLEAVRPAWRQGHASIAGLTTSSPLFCLEQLACAQGMRVVFHAEHVLLPGGRVAHQVLRSSLPLGAATLDRAGSRWPQRLADSLVPPRAPRGPRPGPSLAALDPRLPAGAALLSSWIIA